MIGQFATSTLLPDETCVTFSADVATPPQFDTDPKTTGCILIRNSGVLRQDFGDVFLLGYKNAWGHVMRTVGTMVFPMCLLLSMASVATSSDAKVRVGVYDSRAIAVAFVDSEAYQASAGKQLAAMAAQYREAKAAGNQKRVAELEAQGNAQQILLHKQGFSTAPVDDILAHIKDRMPDIAKAAGVGPIVSKWDQDALAKYKSAELVDVTMPLVRAFHPTERQLGLAIDIQKQAPISLEEAEKM